MDVLGDVHELIALVMPSRRGQKGMTCIRPTAVPAEETAQRSKRLSTSMTAMSNAGGRLAFRLAMHLLEDRGPFSVVLYALETRPSAFHDQQPHFTIEFVFFEAGIVGQGL